MYTKAGEVRLEEEIKKLRKLIEEMDYKAEKLEEEIKECRGDIEYIKDHLIIGD